MSGPTNVSCVVVRLVGRSAVSLLLENIYRGWKKVGRHYRFSYKLFSFLLFVINGIRETSEQRSEVENCAEELFLYK